MLSGLICLAKSKSGVPYACRPMTLPGKSTSKPLKSIIYPIYDKYLPIDKSLYLFCPSEVIVRPVFLPCKPPDPKPSKAACCEQSDKAEYMCAV